MAAPAFAQPGAGNSIDPAARAAMAHVSDRLPVDSGGGASLLKALFLGDIIVANGIELVVEIGVYRGRLLLMLATLLKYLGRGEAIGIDPYSAQEAVQRDQHNVGFDLVTWPETVDWEALHDGLLSTIEELGLGARARLLRRPSAQAVSELEDGTIGMLHVDGNHDHESVVRDVQLYKPKLVSGGFLVMDDVSWRSIRPVFDELSTRYEVVLQLRDSASFHLEQNVFNDFGVLRIYH